MFLLITTIFFMFEIILIFVPEICATEGLILRWSFFYYRDEKKWHRQKQNLENYITEKKKDSGRITKNYNFAILTKSYKDDKQK